MSASTAIGSRGSGPPGEGWRPGREAAVTFLPGPFGSFQFRGGPGALGGVGDLRGCGADVDLVVVGAAGERGIQPLPVLAAGDQRDPGGQRAALRRVPRPRICQVTP